MELLRRDDLGSPLKDILEWRNLKLLDFEDSCKLMQEPIDRQWPEGFLHNVFRNTGGHPMLLQYIMQHVCQNPPYDAFEVDTYANKFIRERYWQFNDWWNKYCNASARDVYNLLPDDGTIIHLREIVSRLGQSKSNEGLEILQHVGLVTEENDGYAFRYASSMFHKWYKNTINVDKEKLQNYSESLTEIESLGQEYFVAYKDAWDTLNSCKSEKYLDSIQVIKIIFENLVLRLGGFPSNTDRKDVKIEIKKIISSHFSVEQAKEMNSDYELLLNIPFLQTLNKSTIRNGTAINPRQIRDEVINVASRWNDLIILVVNALQEKKV